MSTPRTWLPPDRDAWWAVVRQRGPRRFIWRVYLPRYGLPAALCFVLCLAAVQGLVALTVGRSLEWWALSVFRFSLAILALCPSISWFMARAFWRNAEREWHEREQGRQPG